MSKLVPLIFRSCHVPNLIKGAKTVTRRTILRINVRPGDIIYVRESVRVVTKGGRHYWNYYSDPTNDFKIAKPNAARLALRKFGRAWIPGVHAPKESARVWLKVTDYRREPLQAMKPRAFADEGVLRLKPGLWTLPDMTGRFPTAKKAFIAMWDANAKPPCRWEDNPTVHVVEFVAMHKPPRPDTIF